MCIKNIQLERFLWNYPKVNGTRPYCWLVNIGSGNGLVPSGTKPLSEPMMTQIYVNMVSIGHNECIVTIVDTLAPGHQ